MNDQSYKTWLEFQVEQARKNLAYYTLRNQPDERGGMAQDGYTDEDWSGLFEAQGCLSALESALSEYNRRLSL